MSLPATGFRPESFDPLVALEEESFWFRSRNRLLIWALRHFFADARDVLEVGCGTGYVLAGLRAAYPDLRLTGAELHAEGLTHARDRVPDATFIQLDARSLAAVAAWDVIGVFDVLEHIDADERVLARLHRAVRPGGGILVTVPQHPWLWGPADDYACHERRYTRDELVSKVTAAGFRVEAVTSWVSLLLPLLVLSRWRERRARGRFDPTREHARAARLGGALERVADAELALVRRGVSLPAGGSLFLAGRRA